MHKGREGRRKGNGDITGTGFYGSSSREDCGTAHRAFFAVGACNNEHLSILMFSAFFRPEHKMFSSKQFIYQHAARFVDHPLGDGDFSYYHFSCSPRTFV